MQNTPIDSNHSIPDYSSSDENRAYSNYSEIQNKTNEVAKERLEKREESTTSSLSSKEYDHLSSEENLAKAIEIIEKLYLEQHPTFSSSIIISTASSLSSTSSFESIDRYLLPLSKNPPVPINGINNPKSPLIAQHIDQFIAMHKTEEEKEALRYLMNKVDYVSFYEFQNTLHETVQEFFQEIGNEPFILMAEPKKSNKWVAELALNNTSHKPSAVVQMSYLSDVLKANSNAEGSKRIVLMDDAAYSGEQMERFVTRQIEALAEAGVKDFHIHIVIPYATEFALDRFSKIQNLDLLKKQNGVIHIHSKKIMEMASNKITNPKHVETLNSMYYPLLGIEEILDVLLLMKQDKIHDRLEMYNINYSDLLQNPLFQEICDKEAQLTTDEFTQYLNEKKSANSKEFIDIIRLAKSISNYVTPMLNYDASFFGYGKDELRAIKRAHEQIFWEKGLKSRALTIFDHKVADGMSLVACLAEGEVWHNGVIERDVSVPSPYKPKLALPIFIGEPPYKKAYT